VLERVLSALSRLDGDASGLRDLAFFVRHREN
jgi:hypothetical protein